MAVFSKAEFQIYFILQGIPQRMGHGQDAFRSIDGLYLADDITVIFQKFDCQPAYRILDNACLLDHIFQAGDGWFQVGAVIDVCVFYRFFFLGYVHDCLKQLLSTFIFTSHKRNYRSTQLFTQFFQINLGTHAFGNIHHVQTDDDRPPQFNDLGCQIQIPFQVRSVQDVYDDVRFFINNNISCNDFIQRTGCQAVRTGKIDEQKAMIVIIATAFLLFYRNAGVIADMLFCTRNIIKNCRLSAVRIAGEGNLDSSCIIHDY